MNSYIDYDYYKNTYKGELIPESEFSKYSIKASNEVRLRTCNVVLSNLDTDTQELVKTSTCSVMELVYNQEQLKNRYMAVANGTDTIITSEKVGDYSRNLNNLSADELKSMSSDDTTNVLISEELEKSLLFTGLLNRGTNVR